MTWQDIEARRARPGPLPHAHRRAKRPGPVPQVRQAPGRSQCEPCAAKKRPADRARHHRRTAERATQGLCPRCGKRPPAPDRTVRAPSGGKRNMASRASAGAGRPPNASPPGCCIPV